MKSIKDAWKKAGFDTRGKAAAAAGIHRDQLAKYERGTHKPGLEVLQRMANGWGTTIDELTGRPPSATPNPPAA
jgi:transcriptional regulator with XRE-family HTH domain